MPAKALEVPGGKLSSEQLMQLALDASLQGIRGANPLVGAVLANSRGEVLHVGWHRGAGSPHAEADALAQARAAGTDLRGTHMFVSLEPCNHTGRTGPCSRAVADAGVSYLHFAIGDETEDAAGGAAYLRSRGVTVESGLLKDRAEKINRRWFVAAKAKRPWVTAKIASTLDGFIAAEDGSSQWITGAQARADGHELRQRADAILVGTQTVVTDNPRLSARDSAGRESGSQPLRVIMGERDLPEDLAVFRDSKVLQVRSRRPRVVLNELYSRGVRHLMIEGGPTVVSAFLRENLVDELLWYQAPKVLGAGRRGVGDLGISTLSEAGQWDLDDLGMQQALLQMGGDIRLHLAPQN